ncbi:MAG TPA: ABC transporter ATP-binding protein, partial [Bacillota bacterium]
EILVLDEPTTGQDYRESLQIMDLVAELNRMGHTVIFITHDMQLVASYAGRVIMMGKGRVLADGTPREVLPRTDLLAATFLKPPQITQLAQALNDCGFAGDAIRVEELVTVFREKTGTGRHRLAGVG